MITFRIVLKINLSTSIKNKLVYFGGKSQIIRFTLYLKVNEEASAITLYTLGRESH